MNSAPTLQDIERLKRGASKLKKATPGITHSQAIELLAREAGYKTYAAMRAAVKEKPT